MNAATITSTPASGAISETLARGRAAAPHIADIEALERAIAAALPPVDCPLRHHFSDGIYAREITIPAGTVVTGKVHKFRTMTILSRGEVSIYTPEGAKRLTAPAVFVTPPGTKNAVFAHTETVWTTVHATDLTDVDALEAHLVAQDFDEYLLFREEQPKIGSKLT